MLESFAYQIPPTLPTPITAKVQPAASQKHASPFQQDMMAAITTAVEFRERENETPNYYATLRKYRDEYHKIISRYLPFEQSFTLGFSFNRTEEILSDTISEIPTLQKFLEKSVGSTLLYISEKVIDGTEKPKSGAELTLLSPLGDRCIVFLPLHFDEYQILVSQVQRLEYTNRKRGQILFDRGDMNTQILNKITAIEKRNYVFLDKGRTFPIDIFNDLHTFYPPQ